jgi:hypothetical protein
MGVDRRERAALLHPITLVALAVLLVNDHILKAAWPGWWTGKLSDVAALIVGPVAIGALWQAVVRRRALASRAWPMPSAEAVIALGFGAMFVAVKLDPTANEVYARVVGVLGWPFGAAGDLLAGRAVHALGRAPTVVDPGDLIALSAVLVGWWLAAGARSLAPAVAHMRTSTETSVARSAARIAALALALFALAATSASYPSTVTDVVDDVVTVEPGAPPIHRLGTFEIPAIGSGSATEPPTSIRIEARPRWPFNEPPLRFALSVDGVASGPRVAIDPGRCRTGCTIDVDVAIDWPAAAGQDPSSAAWELAATVEQTGGLAYLFYPGVSLAPGGGAASPGWSDAAQLLVFAAILPLAALVIGAAWRSRGRAAAIDDGRQIGIRSGQDIVTVAAGVGLIGLLVFAAVRFPPNRIDPPLQGSGTVVIVLAAIMAAAIAWGLVRWLRGSGTVLAVSLATTAIIGLPVVAMLVASATPTFAERGVQLGIASAALLTAASFFALTRLDPDARGVTLGRIGVLVSQVALLAALLIATGGGGGFAGPAFLALTLHAAALWSWWDGSGRFLGATSFLILAGTGVALLVNGPGLFFTQSWTAADRLLQYGVAVGAIVGLLAAFGSIGRDPLDRRVRDLEDRRAAQVAEKVARAERQMAASSDVSPAPAEPPFEEPAAPVEGPDAR